MRLVWHCVALSLVTVCLLIGALFWRSAALRLGLTEHFFPPHRIPDDVSYARRNLSTLLYAMLEYEHLNGSFPFDSRGDDYALYELRTLVGDSVFNAVEPSGGGGARWDDEQGRVVGSEWEYLNEIGLTSGGPYQPLRIVMVSRQLGVGRRGHRFCVGCANGLVGMLEFPNEAGASLLGCWRGDDFIFGSLDALQSWDMTHAPAASERRRHFENGRMTSERLLAYDIEYRYVYYADGRLAKCHIARGGERITEAVETDGVGRIVALHRSPPEWRSIWDELLLQAQ